MDSSKKQWLANISRWLCFCICLIFSSYRSSAQLSADEGNNNPIGVLESQSKANNWPFVEGMARRLAAQPDKKNNYSPWAEFYLGLAQLKRLKPEDAFIRFKQAGKNATSDDQRTEFKLWAAEAAHDAGMYIECLSLTAAFENQPTSAQPEQVSWAKGLLDALFNQASEDTLDALQRRFPENRRLAYWSARRFMAPKNRLTWAARADELIEKYGLTDLIVSKNSGDTIHAVVLLPIGIKSNDVRVTPRANQPWLDLLEGFGLAAKHLADSGKQVKLHIYDLKDKVGRLEELINSGELLGSDLIIGPVTGQFSPAVAAFAQRYKIPMLNPLTNKVSWSKDNQYCWTTEVPANQVGELLAQKALKMLPTSKVAIVYGPTAQDSIIAAGYRRVMVEAGKPVTLFHKVGKNSAANLPKFLLNSKVDSTGHIFAPNDEPFVKVQLPSALAYIKKRVQVLTVGDWLLSPEANYSSYEQLNFILADPHFAVSQRSGYTYFERAYVKATQIWPSIISAQGYEALMVFGGGGLIRPWQADLATNPSQQFMTGCYDFSAGPANQCIPLYKVVAETVVPVE